MNSLLDAIKVGEILGVSPELVYRMARDGRIPVVRVGTAVRFIPADVEEFIQASRSITPPPQGKWSIVPRLHGRSR